VYGNAGGDFVDCLAGLDEVDGNFSRDPLSCGPLAEHFTSQDESPSVPANSPCGWYVGAHGQGCTTTDVADPNPVIPGSAFLQQNAPNPFNPWTSIPFVLPSEEVVDSVVLDASGRVVRELLHAAAYPPGVHRASWDGRDNHGRTAASGIYFHQ
jgi:hypothetical protein